MMIKKLEWVWVKKPYPFLLSQLSCIVKSPQANMPTKVDK